MKSSFSLLIEKIYNDLFLESVDPSYLNMLDRKINVIKTSAHSNEAKKAQLKKLSKELIYRVLNSRIISGPDDKPILDIFFPNLAKYAGRLPENEFIEKFKEELDKNPLTPENYKKFWETVDSKIDILAAKHRNLHYLTPKYLMYY
jgi:hypothetical protein